MIHTTVTETSLRKIQELLGIEKECDQLLESATIVKAGIPASAMLRLKKVAGLSDEQMAQIVGISRGTFNRRIQEANMNINKQLTPTESDRVYRLAQIVTRATEVFGDEHEAQLWLNEPKNALQGQTPLEVIMTEPGVHQVETMLGRIEHGIFA